MQNCQQPCFKNAVYCIAHKCVHCLNPRCGNSGYCVQHKCSTDGCTFNVVLGGNPVCPSCRKVQRTQKHIKKCAHPGCTTPAQKAKCHQGYCRHHSPHSKNCAQPGCTTLAQTAMNTSGSHTFTFLCWKHANECTSRERTARKEPNHTDSESEEETSQAKAIPDHWGTMLRDNTYQSKQETHCLTPVTFEHVQHTYKNYIAQLADDKWSKQVCAICQEGRQRPKLFYMLECVCRVCCVRVLCVLCVLCVRWVHGVCAVPYILAPDTALKVSMCTVCALPTSTTSQAWGKAHMLCSAPSTALTSSMYDEHHTSSVCDE